MTTKEKKNTKKMAGFAALCGLLALTGLRPGPAAAQQPASTAVAPAAAMDVERLRAQHERIVTMARRLAPHTSLADLVRLVMQDPPAGTVAAPAPEDNRAALVAVAFYVNGWPLAAVVPEARDWPRPETRVVILRGRHDLAQHFTVSALIAAFAGTPLATMAGLYKEMADAHGGSGFSFSDLAADRAGTLFGDAATRSGESARRLRARLGTGLLEDDMMPSVDGLPDNLSRAEFARRYGGVGAPAYNELVETIDRRVAALTLFQ